MPRVTLAAKAATLFFTSAKTFAVIVFYPMKVSNLLASLIFNVQSKPLQPHIIIIANQIVLDNRNISTYNETYQFNKRKCMANQGDNVVKKTVDSITNDLPKLVKENKGAAIGAVVGYLLADKLSENEVLIPALLGGLIGHEVDEKKKEKAF